MDLIFWWENPIDNQQMCNKIRDADLCYEGKGQSKRIADDRA